MKSGFSRERRQRPARDAAGRACVSAWPRAAQHVERPDHAGRADVEVLHRRRRLPAVPLVGRPERVGVVRRVDVGDDRADRVADARFVPRRVGQRLERLRPVEHERHSKLLSMPDVLDLFTELAAIPSPSGEERAVADAVTATCATARSTSRRTTRPSASVGRPATSTRASRDRAGHADLPLRAPRHGAADREDRAGRRRRGRRSQRRRARSSARTTRPRSPSCSRRRGVFSPSGGRTRGSSSCSRRRRKSG